MKDAIKKLLGLTAGFAEPAERNPVSAPEPGEGGTPPQAEAVPAAEPVAAPVADTEPTAEELAELGEDLEPKTDGEGKRVLSRAERKVLKEIGQRKEAEAKLAKASAQIEALNQRIAQADVSGLAAKLETEEDIGLRRLEIRDQLRKVEKAIREGGYSDPADPKKSLSVDELEEVRAALEDERDLSLPTAEKLIRQRDAVERDIVGKVYPDLLREGTQAAKDAAALFVAVPGLKAHPEARLLAGDLLRGRALRLAASAAPAKPAPAARQEPPRDPAAGASSGDGLRRPETANSEKALMGKVGALLASRS